MLTFLRQLKGTAFREESWVRQKPHLFILLSQGTVSSHPPFLPPSIPCSWCWFLREEDIVLFPD